MSITLGSNVAALKAQGRLTLATTTLSGVHERLSSGQRINRASDDAAALAIAESLSLRSRVFGQALKNINDGISLINVATGALSELGTIATRLGELAEQAANGVYTFAQRKALNEEAESLRKEFNRIVAATRFNQRSLLERSNGSVRIQSGFGSDGSIEFGTGDELSRLVGNGVFEAQGSFTNAHSGYQYVTGDIDNDGDDDIIVSYLNHNELTVYRSNGDGSFETAQALSAPTPATNLRLVDLNRDGKLDLFDSGATDRVFLGNGNGTFQSALDPQTAGSNTGRRSVALGDVDGDGILDAVRIVSGGYRVFIGRGDGTFSARQTVSSLATMVTLADLNRDGKLDLITGNQAGQATIGTALGSGGGSFSPETIIAHPTGGIENFQVADTDGDGFPDLLASGAGFTVYKGNGDGTLAVRASYDPGQSAFATSYGDFNGDGIMDLLSA